MRKASLGKRQQRNVKRVLANADYYSYEIQKMLMNKSYVPSAAAIKEITDNSSGKKRMICKPNFYPDQIVHWALMLQLQPVIMRGMYEFNCGSIPHRGTSYGQKTIRKWLDSDPKNTKYCLQMDIKKYYPSIDGEILKQMFRRKIKDADCLWLIDSIVDSNQGQPIGYYTSQWFANFFLQDFDHFVKEKLGVKHYVRYVDDLVLLGPNKKKLHQTRKDIAIYLSGMGLRIKENWQVYKISVRAIDFLGFRFYKDKTTLRKRTSLRIRRRIAKIKKKGTLNVKDASAVISYWGWIKRSDSFGFYHKYVRPVVSIKSARKVVSDNGKRDQICGNSRI
jgi:hypothetical protein